MNQKLMLSDIVDPDMITKEYDYEYAGVRGFAEMIGWKIVFFKSSTGSVVDAIRFFDIETEDEINLCNSILKKLEFPLDFHSDLPEIYSRFGAHSFIENVLTDCDTYCFRFNEGCYISFDISEKKNQGHTDHLQQGNNR